MKNTVRVIIIISFVFILCACGRVHHRIITQPEYFPELKEVKLLPTEMSSKEQHKHALDINEKLKKTAADRFKGILVAKGIVLSDDCDAIVSCRIYVRYGNRALRYFVGYGAGAGRVSVNIELKDKQDTVIYATETKADLAVGDLGGDIMPVIDNVIGEAMQKFITQLKLGL